MRKVSRRAREASVGNPHATPTSRRRRSMNAGSVQFSSGRKSRRAVRGEVNHLIPQAQTRESMSQFNHRKKRQVTQESISRTAFLRRTLIAVCIVVAIVLAGVGIGVFAFNSSINSKIELEDSSVTSALVAQPSSGPYYALFTVDLDAISTKNPEEKADVILLARIDEENKKCTLVSIPVNAQTKTSDGTSHNLSDVVSVDGDGALIKAVASFAGVDISHYAKLGRDGFEGLFEACSPVTINVTEEVDDPTAGSTYIPVGERDFSLDEAITYLKASNYTEGINTRALNQCTFAATMCQSALSNSWFGRLGLFDSFADSFKSDWSASELVDLAGTLEDISTSDFMGGYVPGYETTHTVASSNGLVTSQTTTFTAYTDQWKAVMAAVDSGQDPTSPMKIDTSGVDPASFTITVKNGTGITGLASQYADLLTSKGYKVEETGNTDTNSFTETLIIYKDSAYKAAAESVRQAIGLGRAISSDGFYSFDTDILVIIGGDQKAV